MKNYKYMLKYNMLNFDNNFKTFKIIIVDTSTNEKIVEEYIKIEDNLYHSYLNNEYIKIVTLESIKNMIETLINNDNLIVTAITLI